MGDTHSAGRVLQHDGSPTRDYKNAQLNFCIALALLISALAYSLTLNSSVGWGDSAELALRASQLGSSHAPGSPVHTLFAFVFTQVFAEPAVATAVLSLVAAVICCGVVTGFLAQLTGDPWAGLLGGLCYAFSFFVWNAATMSELYSLATMFLALSLVVFWRWRSGRNPLLLCAGTLVLGLAIGSHLSMLLFVPAIFLFVIEHNAAALKDGVLTILLLLFSLLLIGAANLALASNQPAFGAINPDSLASLWVFMSASQYGSVETSDAAFLMGRMSEHAGIISKRLVFVGVPLALLGIWQLNRTDGALLRLLLLSFLCYFGVYTLFGPGDYFAIVVPIYLILSVWLTMGIVGLPGLWFSRIALAALLMCIVGVQLEHRKEEQIANDARGYISEVFAALPEHAVAVAPWRQFAPLEYAQKVQQLRPDLTLVSSNRTRFYSHGTVNDWVGLVAEEVCRSSVFVYTRHPKLTDRFALEPVPTLEDWFYVLARANSGACADAS